MQEQTSPLVQHGLAELVEVRFKNIIGTDSLEIIFESDESEPS